MSKCPRCEYELVWDLGYGYVCAGCGAKPWRCVCRMTLKEAEALLDIETEEEPDG